jgi:hypothetical protein
MANWRDADTGGWRISMTNGERRLAIIVRRIVLTGERMKVERREDEAGCRMLQAEVWWMSGDGYRWLERGGVSLGTE